MYSKLKHFAVKMWRCEVLLCDVQIRLRPLLQSEDTAAQDKEDSVWKQGTALHGSSFVRVVVTVGKAVWNAILLLKLSGPAQQYNNSGHKERSLQWPFPFEPCRQNFENILLYFLYRCFFSPTCFIVLIQKGLLGCLQAGTKCCRLKSQLWPSCG